MTGRLPMPPAFHPLSPHQKRVVNLPDVTLVGCDDRGRPVIEKPVGIPNRILRWSLYRNGAPADIVGKVTPLPEGWTP